MDTNITTRGAYGLTLEKLGYILVALTVFLLPFFFVPSRFYAVENSKMILLSVGVIGSFFVFLLNTIKRGEFEFPGMKLMWAVLAIPLVFFISALGSSDRATSFFGADVGSFSFITLCFLLFFLVAVTLKTKAQIYYTYLAFGLGFLVVLLISLVKFFLGGDSLTLGALSGSSGNPIGMWTDLAVFFAVGTVVNVIALELAHVRKGTKAVLYVVLLLSLFVLSALNFNIVWLLLLIFSLVFFVYVVSTSSRVEGGTGERRISYPALLVAIVAVIFFWNPVIGGGKIGDVMSAKYGMSSTSVRPSFDATTSVMKSTLKTDALLGSGPSTFNTEWQKHKPERINQSDYWNSFFPAGYGLLPTFVVTTGLIGAILWIAFLVLYVRLGIRALFVGSGETLSRFFLVSSFLSSLFLWVMSIVFVPRFTIFALTFVFSGIFVAVAISQGVVSRRSISFGHNAKLSFLAVLLLIALLVGNVGFVYSSLKSSLSNVALARASEKLRGGEFDLAAAELSRAINMSKEGIYYRALAEVYIQKINSIVNSTMPDSEKAQAFQETLRASIAAAQKGTEVDPSNYENWIALGQIYESLIAPPLSVEGAYENAKKAYESALLRNPHSPEVLLLLARLEVVNGNNLGAREFIEKSLVEKNNFAEAYFLLTQIELQENNLKQAIKSAETLAVLSPNNPGIFFQLGLLKYNDADYRGAAQALSEAVRIVPEYANAKYFLGLSLSKLGLQDLAIKEFEDLKKTNPDNNEIDLILTNMLSGADPFKGFPPGSKSPQTREELPVKQQ